jgi:hypothetical protein
LNFNANHKLPLRGSFGASYSWSDFGGESNGSTVSGSNQMISATAAFAPTDRFTSSFQLNYDSSLSGEIEQQLVGVGAVNPQVNLGTSSYSISMSNFDNVVLTKSLSAGFSVGHIQQEVYGESVSATHFSAMVNYRFLKPLWGTVVVYAGVNDQATDAGNQGAGLVAGANFSKQWSNFELERKLRLFARYADGAGRAGDFQLFLYWQMRSATLAAGCGGWAHSTVSTPGWGRRKVRARIRNPTEPTSSTRCITSERITVIHREQCC